MTVSGSLSLLESVYKLQRADLEYLASCRRLPVEVLLRKEQLLYDLYRGLSALKSNALIGVTDELGREMKNLHRKCPELDDILVPYGYRDEVESDHVGQTPIISLPFPSILY